MSTTKTRPRPRPAAAPRRRPSRPAMDARIRQRRAEVRRAQLRRRRRTLITVVLLLAAAGAAVGVTRSPLFAIADVQVLGAPRGQVAEVSAAAGIHAGANLMAADLEGAAARVLEIPWVASVEVRREPPSTVVVEVSPRRPAAVVMVRDVPWVIDRAGVVIETGTARELPRIDADAGAVPVPGRLLDDPATLNALALHRELPRDVRAAVQTLESAGPRSVRVELAPAELEEPHGFAKSRRVWVRLSSARDVAEQVRVMRGLLGQIKAAREGLPAEIDVRVPSNPVLLP